MSLTTHVAIGCNNLHEAEDFYLLFPETQITRRYDDRVCLNFYSIQLVLHKCIEMKREKNHYPYHFGVNFSDFKDLESLRMSLDKNSIDYNYGIRFKKTKSEHHYLSIFDPFNNCIEFKIYTHSSNGY